MSESTGRKPSRVYYVTAHGGRWKYGKKGGLYSWKSAALQRARDLVATGHADSVSVYESTPIVWTELEQGE